ncbi:MAG: pyrroline-5-carboxylate reductase dimerization domain-containing protein [Mobilitalea sp.]
MSRFGFIGYGSMGRLLVTSLIKGAGIDTSDIYVTRKNKEKLSDIATEWPGIHTEEKNCIVAKKVKYLFLCVKPSEFFEVIHDLKTVITPEHHLISITSALMLEDLSAIFDCKITKIMPTLISEVQEGVTLICHNHKVSNQDAKELDEILRRFMCLYPMEDQNFGFASEITSCGPGFFASILNEFMKAALTYSNVIDKEDMQQLIAKTMYGTTKLILEKSMNFTDVMSRVAVKGGITQEGVDVMEEGLPAVFEEVFHKTMKKRIIVDEKLHHQFKDL